MSGKRPLSQDTPQNARSAKAALLRGCGLYAITNGPRPDLLEVAEQALAGGARLLQYRDKTTDRPRRLNEACALAALCRRHDAGLIVNDDVQLALDSRAHGVHLGADDAGIASARAILGDKAVIGASCYDNVDRARRLAEAGADYLAFGAFFPSPTKPLAPRASLSRLHDARSLGLPLVAIGGINLDNGRKLVAAGAQFLAVISAVFDASDVQQAARSFQSLFASPTEPS